MAMSLWAIKKNTGSDWVDFRLDGSWHYTPCPAVYDDFLVARSWRDRANAGGARCHIVPLMEKPKPIVLSEVEAKLILQAKYSYWPARIIADAGQGFNEHFEADQNRLIYAYVNGWTSEKDKRYLVRVPHANRHYYYQKCDSGEVIPVWDMGKEPPTQFTIAEIEKYCLQDCEKEEVKQDVN